MTKKERVKAAIEGKTPDVTPYYIDLTMHGKQKMAKYYQVDLDALQKTIGHDLLFLQLIGPEDFVPKPVGANMFVDEFGVVWDAESTKYVGDWGLISHPIKDMNTKGYQFPTGKGRGRFKAAEREVAQNPDCFNLLQIVGIFDVAWHTTGIQDMLMSMALDEAFANEMLDLALEYNLNIIDQLPEYIDGIRFLEDWGDQKCLMMGPKNWRSFLKPRLKIMYEACKRKGCAVFAHSCGNITELFPDLIEIGVDVIDPIQPEVMDLQFIKKEYGTEIVLFGGIGCQSIIPLGTPEMVIKACQETVELLSEGGRYIFGSSGAIPNETPIENIAALIEFCKVIRLEGITRIIIP